MDKTTAFSVVELTQECNKEKVISDNHLFSTRENALAFLHHQYLDIRLKMDVGSGEFSADCSNDGWYQCVDNDGDCYEGYISECLTVDEAITPEMIEEYREDFSEDNAD